MDYSKKDQEFIEKANRAIGDLVYDKDELQKAYNYYHGVRDQEQFRYLEENFGIGNATAVQFTPLIKKHVDALVGEYLGIPLLPRVTCKDPETICNMQREKELHITAEVYKFLQRRLNNKILKFAQTQDQKELQDPQVQKQLDQLIADLSSTFVSKYEVAAQHVVQYIMQSRQTDLQTKLRQLFTDLLITGYSFYRVSSTPDGANVSIEILNPLDTFFDKNYNSPYVKDSYRAVVRRWLTKSEILSKYGDSLTKDDKELIDSQLDDNKEQSKYIRASRATAMGTGINACSEVALSSSDIRKDQYNSNLIPVYDIEWTETDKNCVMQRYNVIKIGSSIYIVNGLDKSVQRSVNNPNYCPLSINGVYFDNRTNEPFSLVKSCMHLQDKYDLLLFYRDNIIANSGTVGDWVDLSLIPSYLGGSWSERLQKWLAYKKQGTGLIDSSQEGRIANGQAQMNTIFNGFDDTVKANAIQAIQYAIDSIEQTMCSITGVFRERLNGIEQRDAVTNVKASQTNSFTVTKHWFQQMDITVEELLTDVLNKAKIVFKNGLTGTLILGDKYQKIFTAMPEYFTISDHDIHVLANSDIIKDTEVLKQLVPEFVRMQAIPADVILEVMDVKSLSEAKQIVRSALDKQRNENDQLMQLQQQLQEAQGQLQQAQQQLQQAQNQNEELSKKLQQVDEQKLQMTKEKQEQEIKIKWFEARTERNFREAKIENDNDRVKLEEEQMFDNNPYNDKIKNY